MRRWLFVLALLSACNNKRNEPPPAPQQAPLHNAQAQEPPQPQAPTSSAEHTDAAQVQGMGSGGAGAACTSARDCKLVEADSDCSYACVSGVCQLRGTTKTAGAGPCYGEILAQAVTRQPADTAAPVSLLCDAYASLYCNRATHTCDAVKKRGASCTTQNECGLDGACVHGTCADAPKVGQACEPGVTSCGRVGFCDAKARRCQARRDNGQPCDNLGEQCKSAFCGPADATHKAVCTPPPWQRHCPEIP